MESEVCQSMETNFGQQTQNQIMDCAVFIFWVSSLGAHRGRSQLILVQRGISKTSYVKFWPDWHKGKNSELGTTSLGATWVE